MNNLAYREGRVKFSDDIEKTIFKLMKSEDDVYKKKKHRAQWYRAKIAEYLNLKEKENPSLRSYEEKIRYLRNQFQVKNPLDDPWTIGACEKYDIPASIIPTLIELQRILKDGTKLGGDLSGRLTIRRARWIARLYPSVMSMAKEQYPDNPRKQLGCLSLVAGHYTFREQISKIQKKDYADTSDLDKLFFFYQDLSDDAFGAALVDEFIQSSKRLKLLQDNEKFPLSNEEIAELETKLGKNLNSSQLKLFEELANINNPIAQHIWLTEHQEFVQEIQQEILEAKNERSHN